MSVKQFWRDDDGVILPYVAITLVVIIGLSALGLDGGRLMSLQTQVQNSADALALASFSSAPLVDASEAPLL